MPRKADRPKLSKEAVSLRQKLEADRSRLEEIKANITAVAEGYDLALEDVEAIVREASKRTSEDDFQEVMQGSKGTGLQESNQLVTLRQLRLQRDLSLRQLSELMGIPFPHVSEIERGMRQMTPNEQDTYEQWAGGRIHYRMVPYVRLSDEGVE